MHTERMTALATTAANNHGNVVALKREERPLSQDGKGTLLTSAVQKMTVSDFGNHAAMKGIRPSVILAESELQREPSERLA